MSKDATLISFAQDITDRFEPVSPERHQTSSWSSFTDFTFARRYKYAPIVLAELHLVASTLPILFENGPSGIAPVALLKMGNDGPHVVSDDGHWTAFFVPGSLRIHPFYTEATDPQRILIDTASDAFSTLPNHTRFYDVTGLPTRDWSDLEKVLLNYSKLQALTQTAAQTLRKGKLLVPARTVRAFDSPLFDNLSIIDRKALNELPSPRIAMLQNSGALELIYAHFTSLETMTQIKRLAAMRDNAPARRHSTLQPKDDFLDAMALAYEIGDGATAIDEGGS